MMINNLYKSIIIIKKSDLILSCCYYFTIIIKTIKSTDSLVKEKKKSHRLPEQNEGDKQVLNENKGARNRGITRIRREK